MWEGQDAESFCAAMQPALYGALLLYCGSREVAEDLTQETLLRVWAHWSSVAQMDRPDRWALRVAFNLAKSSFRRLRVARRIAASTRVPLVDERDPADAIALRAAVSALPARQRAVVVLRYFNDLSIAETATVLGCAEGTVKALTNQGVANLRRHYGPDLVVQQETRHA